jgi:hypothetical protein
MSVRKATIGAAVASKVFASPALAEPEDVELPAELIESRRPSRARP